MACGKCEREFMGELVMQCPISVAVAAMKAVRCPHCGSRKILMLFGNEYRRALQALEPSAASAEE